MVVDIMEFKEIPKVARFSFVCGSVLGISYAITGDLGYIVGSIGLLLMSLIISYGDKILEKLEDKK